jgi:hypothetical protein
MEDRNDHLSSTVIIIVALFDVCWSARTAGMDTFHFRVELDGKLMDIDQAVYDMMMKKIRTDQTEFSHSDESW